MAYAAGPSVAGYGTTAAIDTTGYTLLIAATVGEGGHTLTDSKGNTWTALTTYGVNSTFVRLYYCVNPTVGTGHTFTASVGYRAVAAMAFTGQAATPFDQQNGANTTSGSSLSTGSITPTENDELVFTAIGLADTLTSISVNSGFTTSAAQNSASGTNFGIGIGHIIQTTAGAVNPAWSWTGSTTQAGAAIASFKAASSGTAVGLATETDAAQVLAGKQLRALGLATETDAAQALSGKQIRALGLATETDSALALAGQQLRAVGLSTEVDTAQALSASAGDSVGLASESDTAFALAAVQKLLTGVVQEADTALTLSAGTGYTDLELILKILSNRQELNAGTGTFTIYDDDSVSVLFTANAWSDAAGTIPYSGGTLGRIDALA